MAAADLIKIIKDEATCSICWDLFRDPVTTECGHSFCTECIAQHCEEKELNIICPLCKKTFQKRNLRPNRELKNIVESMNQSLGLQREEESGGGSECEKHQEPLKLFCKNDQTPICVICKESLAHRAHLVVPMEEVVQECKETIITNLEIIESTCEELHLLEKKNWKHLPQSLSEEENERLKGAMEKVSLLLKLDIKCSRQRFKNQASLTQPAESELKRFSPRRKIAVKSELQRHKVRENIRDRMTEKQETASHSIHICEEMPDHKRVLDQASLDPIVHTIHKTTEQNKVDIESFRRSFQSLMKLKQMTESGGRRKDKVPTGGNVATQTELQGYEEERREMSEGWKQSSTHFFGETEISKPVVGRQGPRDHQPLTEACKQEDVQTLTARFESLTSPKTVQESGVRGKDNVSPGRNVPAQTESQGHEEKTAEVSKKQKEAATHVHKEAEIPKRLVDPKSHCRRSPVVTPVKAGMEAGESMADSISPGRNVALQMELQGCAVDVTLDPATAHPLLILSKDWRSLRQGDRRQDQSDNPERFDVSTAVLGSEGFTSGRHYWEVEVEPEGYWAVGVARDSVRRKGKILLQPEEGIWALTSFETLQFLHKIPRKIGVYLNYARGDVTFYNAENMTLIFSLAATFTEKVVPFFCIWSTGSYIKLSASQR